MKLHFVVIIGNWKFENWHLYRWTMHCSAKKPDQIRWHNWDRVL